jgi:DNA-directed RNA polymerase specialized sigma24 family protein
VLSDSDVVALVHRLHNGDEDAASELYSQLDLLIRKLVTKHIRDRRLRAAIDPYDVCQIVMLTLWRGLTQGRFSIQTLDDLLTVTYVVTRRVTLKMIAHCRSACRDVRRTVQYEKDWDCPCPSPPPDDIFARSELIQAILKRLRPKVRYLVEEQLKGRSLGDLANVERSNIAALRMRIRRALSDIPRNR